MFTKGLHALDWVVIVASLFGSLYVGAIFARKQKTIGAYFAANRSIPSWAVGMSILATLISSVTFLEDDFELATLSEGPYQLAYTAPVIGDSVTLKVQAVDASGNIGVSDPVVLPLIDDPHATVTGRVVDMMDQPVAGASVEMAGVSDQTDQEGRFTLADLPTLDPEAGYAVSATALFGAQPMKFTTFGADGSLTSRIVMPSLNE